MFLALGVFHCGRGQPDGGQHDTTGRLADAPCDGAKKRNSSAKRCYFTALTIVLIVAVTPSETSTTTM